MEQGENGTDGRDDQPGGGAPPGSGNSKLSLLGQVLRNGLAKVCAQRPLAESASVAIVTLVAKVAGVKTGALLGRGTDDRVTMLASLGADPGALRALTEGAGRHIPLRAMQERRRHVVSAGKVSIIAVPIEFKEGAHGAVVLFAPNGAPVGDEILDVVQGALGVCGPAIAELVGIAAFGENEAEAAVLVEAESVMAPSAPMRSAVVEAPPPAPVAVEEIKREIPSTPVMDLNELRQLFQEMTVALRERTETVALLEEQLGELSQKAGEAEQLERALASSTARRLAVEGELNALRGEMVETHRREIEAKTQEIAALHEQLESAAILRGGLEEEVSRARAELADVKQELSDLQEGTERATEHWTNTVGAIQAEAGSLAAQLAAAKEELERGGTERGELRRKVNEMRSALESKAADEAALAEASSRRVAALEAERERIVLEGRRREEELTEACARMRAQMDAMENERRESAQDGEALLQLVAELEQQVEELRADHEQIERLRTELVAGDRTYAAIEGELVRVFEELTESRAVLLDRMLGGRTPSDQ